MVSESALAQDCRREWMPGFVAGGPNGTVRAAVQLAGDQLSPANILVFGGEFSAFNGVSVPGVAAWDGQQAVPLSNGLLAGSVVDSLVVADLDREGPLPASLVAGGRLLMSDGSRAAIAQWANGTWTALRSTSGSNPDQTSRVLLAVHDFDGPGPSRPSLVAYSSGRLWRWDVTDWTMLASGTSAATKMVSITNGGGAALYVGRFAGTGMVQRFTGDGPTLVTVSALAGASTMAAWAPDPSSPAEQQLVVGGSLFSPPLRYGYGVFDGQTLVQLGAANDVGGAAASGLGSFLLETNSFSAQFQWNGLEHSLIANRCCPSVFSGTSVAPEFIRYDPDGVGGLRSQTLLFGGIAPNWVIPISGIGRLDESGFHELWRGGNSLDTPAASLAWYDADGSGEQRGSVWAAGALRRAGETSLTGLARWDGMQWFEAARLVYPSSLGPVANSVVTWDQDGRGNAAPTVFVGGRFSSIDAVAVSNVAALTNGVWRSLGGLSDEVRKLRLLDTDVQGPQPTQLAAITTAPALKVWSGTAWQSVGTNFPPDVVDVESIDPDGDGPLPATLYGTMAFAPHFVRLDDGRWTLLQGYFSSGLPNAGLVRFDDDGDGPVLPALYVGGSFTGTTSPAVSLPAGLGRFDGTTWTNPLPPGITGRVSAMSVVDDDGDPATRPVLLIAGSFVDSRGGGSATFSLATWNGQTLTPMTGIVKGGDVGAMLMAPDAGGRSPSLFLSGTFSSVGDAGQGGVPAAGFARMGCAPCIQFDRQPIGGPHLVSEAVTLNVQVRSDGPLSYQWRRNGQPITDSPGRVVGSRTPQLQIKECAVGMDGVFDVLVTSGCGSAPSGQTLVQAIPNQGIFTFLDQYFNGLILADLSGDGRVGIEDVFWFVRAYLGSCE